MQIEQEKPVFRGQLLEWFCELLDVENLFLIVQKDHLEWAEKNCNAEWETKYPDPGPTTDWIDLNNYQQNLPSFDDDLLIGNLPGCKNVVDGSWFGDEQLETCQFDITLNQKKKKWITQFFNMKGDNSGCEPGPSGERAACYCDISLSNNWISVHPDHHHPAKVLNIFQSKFLTEAANTF